MLPERRWHLRRPVLIAVVSGESLARRYVRACVRACVGWARGAEQWLGGWPRTYRTMALIHDRIPMQCLRVRVTFVERLCLSRAQSSTSLGLAPAAGFSCSTRALLSATCCYSSCFARGERPVAASRQCRVRNED